MKHTKFFPVALIAAFTANFAGPVAAHPGHLIEAAGHDHWLAGVAIGTAIAIGLWQGLKGKSGEEGAQEAEESANEPTNEPTGEEPQEA